MAKKKTSLAAALFREQEIQREQKERAMKAQLNMPKSERNGKGVKGGKDNKNKRDQIKKPNSYGNGVNKRIQAPKKVENKEEEEEEEEEEEDQDEHSTQTEPNTHPSFPKHSQSFIPFHPSDKILLVGDGDLSFSRSILENGLARRIKPTNLDSQEVLVRKYKESVEANIKYLEEFVVPEEEEDGEEEEEGGEEEIEGEEQEQEQEEQEENDDEKYDFRKYVVSSTQRINKSYSSTLDNQGNDSNQASKNWSCSPLYNIDATYLHKSKQVKQAGPFDAIVFNFPHTGAGIKDQDRNVLQHQKLMLSFFQSCLGGVSLKTAEPSGNNGNRSGNTNLEPLGHRKKVINSVLSQHGVVIVSLFEGLPYSLWDIRRLAREAGLSVKRTGRFEWEQFPGYAHRLTTGGKGDITSTGTSNNTDTTSSSPNTEHRAAKFYVFERVDNEKREARLKQQEAKRQQNKQLQAMKNNLKGKKGKRKLKQLVKKHKGKGASD